MNYAKKGLEILRTALIVIILVMGINMFVFQAIKVDGASMEPSLHNEDKIYVFKLEQTLRMVPNYGDIVIIDSRNDRQRTLFDSVTEHPFIRLLNRKAEANYIWIKRVIGLPGDELRFANNKIYRNGEELDETYIKEEMIYLPNETIVVPEGHVFVMGDNRNISRDSRDIGPVPLQHILGKKAF